MGGHLHSLDPSNRMLTRHQGQRVMDYAAMHNRNSLPQSQMKAAKTRADNQVKPQKKNGNKNRGGLGFADSDEERDLNNSAMKDYDSEQLSEEGEEEQNEDPSQSPKSHLENEEEGEEEMEEERSNRDDAKSDFQDSQVGFKRMRNFADYNPEDDPHYHHRKF